MSTTTEHHDDQTMQKVYDALTSCDLSDIEATEAVSAMQNAGILFRERTPR